MTNGTVQPYRAPEAKVTWASVAATVLTALVFTANNTDLIPGYEGWPIWLRAILSVLVIAGGTGIAGYSAPHTHRPDLVPDR